MTNPELEAPLTQNQVVGTVNFLLNDEVIEQRPLVVKEAVEEGVSLVVSGTLWLKQSLVGLMRFLVN